MFSYKKCLSIIPYLPTSYLTHYMKRYHSDIKIKGRVEMEEYLLSHYDVHRSMRKQFPYLRFQHMMNDMISSFLQKYKREWNRYKSTSTSFDEKIVIFTNEKNKLLWLFNKRFIDKTFLIQHTYDLIQLLDIQANDDATDETSLLFNYQYYNAMIKYRIIHENAKREDLEILYKQKDKSILELIKHTCPSDVEAYYISVQSKTLYFSLYEVYFKNSDIIMHSVNPEIKYYLREQGCFVFDILTSRVDDYVNSTY